MPRLHIIEGPLKGRTFDLIQEVVFIGRSAKNDIQIKDSAISRKQIKIFRIGNNFFVEDLKSTNGTVINTTPISPGEGFEVADGDIVSVGNTLIRLEDLRGGPTPALRPQAPKGIKKERRRQHTKDLELSCKITELLRQSLDLRRICEETLAFLLEAFPRIDRAVIVLSEEEGLIKEVFTRLRERYEITSPQYSRKIVEQVIGGRKAIRMSDTSYENPASLSETMHKLEIKSILCVPMISRSRVVGAIYVDSIRGPYGFRKTDLMLLNSLSGPVAVAAENAQLVSRLKGEG